MRRAARVDDNHKRIVSCLRAAGATVISTAAVGKGCPDLICGFRGTNYLLEVKDGSKPPSARKRTPAQEAFFELWRGQAAVVKSVDEALKVIGATA